MFEVPRNPSNKTSNIGLDTQPKASENWAKEHKLIPKTPTELGRRTKKRESLTVKIPSSN